MRQKRIVLLNPGAMGAAIGAACKEAGHLVYWVSEGRSPATHKRAQERGLIEVATLKEALRKVDIVISVCPPHAAQDQAAEVIEQRFRGIYLDANAISPATSQAIQQQLEAARIRYVDGGVIGLPPVKAGMTRLYLAGTDAEEVAQLFAGSLIGTHCLDAPAGAASALKMAYAAWTKGAGALLGNIRALAQANGVEEALLDEWALSQPGLVEHSRYVAERADKAWRWVGEMQEIAATFEAAGLPGDFHQGAADIYQRLALFKGVEEAPSFLQVSNALLKP